MRVSDLVNRLESIAPPSLAEPWDNVGLVVGDPQATVSRVLLAIDYTPEVAAEAADAAAQFVVAYHPPIFKPLSRLTPRGPSELVFDAVRRGIAIYSPHTALDAAEGGTNDVLADMLAMQGRRPLRPAASATTAMKLVAFVPPDKVDAVAEAVCQAGAGVIGDYTRCTFRAAGTGTFLGAAGTTPAVGVAGRLESVDEVRLETVMPAARVGAVIAALRASHPYEEPAFDLYPLAAAPSPHGLGRVGGVPEGATVEMLVQRLKRELETDRLLVAGDVARVVRRAAVCAGSCGDLLDAAIAEGVDLYVTGEMRHHDALRAVRAGVAVVCALHSVSERPTLKRLAQRLAATSSGVTVAVSRADRDPFAIC